MCSLNSILLLIKKLLKYPITLTFRKYINPVTLDKSLHFKVLEIPLYYTILFPCSTLPHSLLDSQKHIKVHLPFDVILQQVVKKVLNPAVSVVSASVMEYANLGEGFIERLAQPFSFTYGDVLSDTVLLFLFWEVERNSLRVRWKKRKCV